MSSIFDPEVFADPPNCYRPLQIVHGLDRFLTRADGSSEPQERDPAGEWSERLAVEAQSDELTGLEGIDAQLKRLLEAGLGGIVTNVAYQDYLVSPQQWELLRYGQRKASELGLRVWLYDEKGYPSGSAGGIVTRAFPEYAALGLACYVTEVNGPKDVVLPMAASCRALVSAVALRDPEHATPDDVVALDAFVDDWDVLRWRVPEGTWTILTFAERVAYEGTHSQGNVCEFKHYINLLEPAATKAFLRVTHEAYARELDPDLWQDIEAIFTDEPSFMTYYVPALPERYQGKVPVVDMPLFQDRPPAVPWARDFLAGFQADKGYDLKSHLFSLFFSQAEEACYVRQDFYDTLTRRYVDAFYGQIQEWCRAHGVAFSGHVLLEESIVDHVAFHGDLFAVIRKMDLPGIDMLNSDPHDMLHGGSFMGASYMAIKQVASVAHLTGCERAHSESSDWEQRNRGQYASLDQRRGQAALQYVLGLNQITSYFGWQEFTAADQRQYHDYVGRLGTLLTGGRHVCDVAVLYPVRTLWSHYVPPLEPIASWVDRPARSEWEGRLAKSYPAVVKELLCHQLDLDIVDEQALWEGAPKDGALCVAGEAYRAIVLPPMDTLSLASARALEAFCDAGGTLISVGAPPDFADSAENTVILRGTMARLFGAGGSGTVIALDGLAESASEAVPPDVTLAEPNPDLLTTHRYLDGRHVYFVVNNSPEPVTIQPVFREPGPYTLYRPLTGDVMPDDTASSLALAGYESIFVVTEPNASRRTYGE